jgi:hypothetical protein
MRLPETRPADRVRPCHGHPFIGQIVWANPNLSITSSDFGKTIAQANTGRRLQHALRLEF